MAGNIKEAADLWKLEKYLTHARNEIDEKYDYRYSVLPIVFGNLLYSGQLSLEDLDGLGEDKLKFIRSYAFVYGEPD